MKKILSDFLFYNKKQKIGVFIFCTLTLINVCIILIDPFPVIQADDFSSLIREMDSLDNLAAVESGIKTDDDTISRYDTATHQERFVFDPNTVTEQELRSLGFKKSIAQRIINFRNKGGKFRDPESIKKIYGIDEEFYKNIAEYIVIIPTREKKNETSVLTVTKEFETVEINAADSAGLCSIRGIGQGFARRILRYREKLGGYIHKEQLLEIYGMDSSKFEAISPSVRVDPEKIRRIRVNLISEADLARHPYIGYRLSKRIIAYRMQHGKFYSVNDLNKIEAVSTTDIEKIKPYIITD